ncbi:MAG TPA: hypothetical protein VFI24_03080 [Pyrinomonadaceae bacterium]|nr:hypothetical protein [Pyrinomonadaceae bacterium]
MRRFQPVFVVAGLLVLSGTVAGCWLFAKQVQRSAKDVVPYEVLDDYMGTTIKIGVVSTINEKELRATLAKAADDHQDDPARDYLASRFLQIEAYLIKDGKQSNTPAGTLRRSVPAGNPAERRKLTVDRTRDDTFTIRIAEARNSLN